MMMVCPRITELLPHAHDHFSLCQYRPSLHPSSEEAYEQENEYIGSPSPILFLIVSLPNFVTHSPLYFPRFEDEVESDLEEDKMEMWR